MYLSVHRLTQRWTGKRRGTKRQSFKAVPPRLGPAQDLKRQAVRRYELLAEALTDTLVLTDTVTNDVTSTVTEADAGPALMFVFTFMPCLPYRGVRSMGLVTGLRPFRSAVAMEGSLARPSDGLCPFLTATRASSSGRILTFPSQVIIEKSHPYMLESRYGKVRIWFRAYLIETFVSSK